MKIQPLNDPIFVQINGKVHEILGDHVLEASSQGMTISDIAEAYAEGIPGAQVQGILHNKGAQAATEAVLNNHLEEATQSQVSKAPPPRKNFANSNLENHLQQSQEIDPGVVQSSSKQAATPEIQYEGMDRKTGDWYITYEGERYQIPKAYVDQRTAQNKNRDQIAWEAIQHVRQSLSSAPPLPVQEVQEPVPQQQRIQEPVPQQQPVQEPVGQQAATGSNGATKPNWINTAGKWIGNNKVATGLGAAGAVGVLTLAGLAVQNAARQQQEQDEYERQLRYMTGWR